MRYYTIKGNHFGSHRLSRSFGTERQSSCYFYNMNVAKNNMNLKVVDYEDDVIIAKTEHNDIDNNYNSNDDDENQPKFTNSRHEPGSHSKHISISQGF